MSEKKTNAFYMNAKDIEYCFITSQMNIERDIHSMQYTALVIIHYSSDAITKRKLTKALQV